MKHLDELTVNSTCIIPNFESPFSLYAHEYVLYLSLFPDHVETHTTSWDTWPI